LFNEEDDFELVHGSGNVFRDLGDPDADILQLKSRLAAEIIRILDDGGLSAGEAAKLTGIATSDFARIRNVKLKRFSIDRLIKVLNQLGQEVRFALKVTDLSESLAVPANQTD
jgi:predicted XRE-type DNA-binding protein